MAMKGILLVIFVLHTTSSLKIIDLGGPNWIVQNPDKSILVPAIVPGGIYSDLSRAKIVKDYIYKNGNDQKYRWIGKTNWSYSTRFQLTKNDLSSPSINITFHGVDTVADVYINKKLLGRCKNMFVRYSFDVKQFIQEGTNVLELVFYSPIYEAKRLAATIPYPIVPECPPSSYGGECHINQLRKMQASFSWDWGPAFPSVGIWKPVHIEMSEGKVLRSLGTYLTSAENVWRLTVRSWFDGDKQVTGDLFVNLTVSPGKNYNLTKKNVSVAGEEKQVLLVPKNEVKLWWPNGQGDQPLYNITVRFVTKSGETSEKSALVAFRTVELSQETVSDDWSKGQRFYFKVNDVPIFMKGSNWIPSHALPEELGNTDRIHWLLKSAADANFNMLRVWGGGIYESDFFYSTCDRLGIMIWQDLMFACSMYPSNTSFLESVKTEVEQNLRRIQHHPCVAVIAGNNENEAALRQNWYGTKPRFETYKDDYIELYVNTVEPIVTKVDPQRPYLISSPSNGIQSEREGFVAQNPQSNLYGDVHFYNYFSNLWMPDVYPHPRFSSEYGTQSLPSMKTLRKVFEDSDLVWGSNALLYRNHLPAGNDFLKLQIDQNLPNAMNLSDIIYLSQINQAMAMKTETELYRRLKSVQESTGEGLTMGALFWQLNSIWETPSWSSIDFQGNWKMLHYYARDFFSNLIISPEKTVANDLNVSVVSDLQYPTKGIVTINVYNWTSFEPKFVFKTPFKVDGGKSVQIMNDYLLRMVGSAAALPDLFLEFKMTVEPLVSVPDNYIFPVPLKGSSFQDAVVSIESVYKTTEYTAEMTLRTDKIALFVWLEANDTMDFHFSKNGFHMLEPTTVVSVISKTTPIGDGPLLEYISVRNLKPLY